MIQITEPNKVDLEYMSVSELSALKDRVEKRLKKMTPKKIKEINSIRHAKSLEDKLERILEQCDMKLEDLTTITRKEFLGFREVSDVMLAVAEIKLFHKELFFLDAKPIYDKLVEETGKVSIWHKVHPAQKYMKLITEWYGKNPSFEYIDYWK
jgi:hypothetical protein